MAPEKSGRRVFEQKWIEDALRRGRRADFFRAAENAMLLVCLAGLMALIVYVVLHTGPQ